MTTTLTRPAAAPDVTPAPERRNSPLWTKVGLAVLLLGTGRLYLWDLSASGWANAFYSAAVQAGATSWKAFFFGSSDAANFITVDKTPAALWVMDLSARIFGVNTWSILVPQALEGVAAVGLLYATVKRWYGPVAGLLAGSILALTPVAVLMFRFNNPDALLVLLLVAAAYATTRAIERAGTRWLLLAGALVGFGFLTKMLQALLVVPAFGLAYLLGARTPLRRRIGQLLAAGAALVASAGWWVAIVELWPAASRPYIGGSQHNSILELTLGYNGLGRLSGSETGSVGGGVGWGATGWSRLFSAEIGGQVAWLLPAALILLVAAFFFTRRRAALLLWGGWLVTTALVFSYMQGIFHAYHTVALAPAIAATVAIGATILWRRRTPAALAVLGATVGVTALWTYTLLGRSSDWHPWLRPAALIAGLAAALGLVAALWLAGRIGRVAAVLAVVAALAGPLGYALSTAATAHTGAIPSAGPTVAGAGFGGGSPGGGGGFGGGPAAAGGAAPGGSAARGGGGGMSGLLDAPTPGTALVTRLDTDRGRYTWVAAAVGSNNAAGYQLATGRPVLALGGFNGSDPAPTLAQFQKLVAAGKIHYFIGTSLMTSASGSSDAQQIASWVAAHFTSTTVDGVAIYDLTS